MIEVGIVSERILTDTTRNSAHDDIASLESDIHDIHDTFCMMNTLIHEQQPNMDTLESEIEAVNLHTMNTVQELEHASRYRTKSRSKLLTFGIIGSLLLSLPVVAVAGIPAAVATTTIVGGGACILFKGRQCVKTT